VASPNPDNTSRNRIYRDIRRAIILGYLQPGTRLSVKALARKYGTSVTPVRDALQMLGQEGLVTIRPRSGYFVTRVTLKQLRDLFELREILEVAAVERAAARITDEEIKQLEQVHAGYTGEDDDSYERYTDENRHFHYLVARASGNEELAQMVGHLLDRLGRFMVMRRIGKALAPTHARLIEALRAHDVEAARRAILAELTETRDVVLDRVIREEGALWYLAAKIPEGTERSE